MLRIDLDKTYTFLKHPGDIGFRLIKHRKNKDGSWGENIVGYYSTVEDGLNGYVKEQTKNSNATTIKELHDEIKELKAYVKKIAEGQVE